jgi:hypothetical protein
MRERCLDVGFDLLAALIAHVGEMRVDSICCISSSILDPANRPLCSGILCQHKLGLHRFVCRTKRSNIRITTFFAGEHEARTIDPDHVERRRRIGCRVTSAS